MRGDSPLIPVESGLIITWVPGRDATRDAGRTGRVLDGASTMPLSSPRIRDGTRRRHPPGSLTWRDSGAPDDPDGTWPQAHRSPVTVRSTGRGGWGTPMGYGGRCAMLGRWKIAMNTSPPSRPRSSRICAMKTTEVSTKFGGPRTRATHDSRSAHACVSPRKSSRIS